jgi:Asp-tRNA(Asn)/Glu-tRNA(Gln) amidotransferase A subunit family amidase
MAEKLMGRAGVTPRESVSSANEICRMDAVTLAEKIRTRQLSPTEVTDAVIARMEKLNPVLGASHSGHRAAAGQCG